MLEFIKTFTVSGGLGILVGLAVVWWVHPRTPGGTALLIVISVAVLVVAGEIVSRLRGKRDKKDETPKKAKPPDKKTAEKETTPTPATPPPTSAPPSPRPPV